jgi:hypothetical protein
MTENPNVKILIAVILIISVILLTTTLSKGRAIAVVNYLITRGIKKERLNFKVTAKEPGCRQ